MGIKTYNPYTPSRRNMTGSDFSEITKSTPEKSLLAKKSKNAGRNNQGKITVRHHGGGNRQKYRMMISRETRKAFQHRLSELSTIQTEQLTSLLSATQMARRHISLLLRD